MKPLAVFTDKDVFRKGKSQQDPSFTDRLTGKAVVFDRNNLALIGNKVNSFYLLPGGGIEEGESIEEGVVRECLEEIGYQVKLIEPLGVVEDYRQREKRHKISHCYIAEVVGEKGNQKLTESEKRNGLHVIWVSLAEAIKILTGQAKQLRNGEVTFYNTGFNIVQDKLFLEKTRELTKP